MRKKKIKIYGERNTGTNFLSKLIDLNFDCKLLSGTVPSNLNRIIKKVKGTENIKDKYFKITEKNNLGWKHREIDKMFLRNLNQLNEDVGFLTLTKNPYSWLLSLYNRPYHYKDEKPSFEKFLEKPWKTVGRETILQEYANPIEMWNIKTRSYLSLEKQFKVYPIKYEDLLLDPIKELHKISLNLELNTKKEFPVNFNKSTKDSDKNSNYYKDYYGNEKWRLKLEENHISIINTHLDNYLLERFNYSML